jgi:hypothetical protein
MDETELRKTLQDLARVIVRNEIVAEHFLCGKGLVSREELGTEVREVDERLQYDREWQNRFPGLFAD